MSEEMAVPEANGAMAEPFPVRVPEVKPMVGRATAHRAALKALYEKDPVEFREKALARLMPDAIMSLALAVRGAPPFRSPQRWALRIVMEIAKWTGAQHQVSILIQQQLGAPVEEGRSAVRAVRMSRDMSREEKMARCEAYLLAEYRLDPVAASRSPLSSVFARVSGAEVVDGG